jgi:hypothetical protein
MYTIEKVFVKDLEKKVLERCFLGLKEKLGNDLLSHTLVCSTIGDEGLDF